MPLRPDPTGKQAKAAVCINCPDVILSTPHCRYTLEPDDGFSQPQRLPLFALTCTTCGYTELYVDGYLLKSNNESGGGR